MTYRLHAAVLGIRPVLGRLFTADEERLGPDAQVALISHSLWESRYGGDPGVVGSRVAYDRGVLTIVGVLRPRFRYPYEHDLWMPWSWDPTDGTSHELNVVARMAEGVTLAQVRQDLDRIASGLRERRADTNADLFANIESLRDDFIRDEDQVLLALVAAVAFHLLLACVNVANLFVARFVARRREVGIRLLNGEPPANSAPVVVNRRPGDGFSYSGGGYQVMQQALQDVTGQRYPELLEERVLIPIGMTRSTFEQPIPDTLRDRAASGYYASGVAVPDGHHIYPEMAAGGLWTTPADLALFLIEIQNALESGEGRVFTRSFAETLLTEVERDYGLGFDLWTNGGQPYFGHYGANDGFRCAMIAHRTSGDGVVILTNSDRGSDLYPDVIRLVAEREGWPGY